MGDADTAKAAVEMGQQIMINWTFVISTVIVCLTILTGLVRVFGFSQIKDEQLRKSAYLKEIKEKGEKNSSRITNNHDKLTDINTEVEKLKLTIQQHTEKIDEFKLEQSKKIDELKREQRELVGRLDELLKQLLEMTG